MPDYDTHAIDYDQSHGGDARAEAAAAALRVLVGDASKVVDVGGGTGIVSQLLRDRRRNVFVVDVSQAMLAHANRRMPGRAIRASGEALPFQDESVDAITCVWLLHLLPPATVRAVVAEAARVLRVGGRFVTTVDKSAAHDDGSDVAELTAELRSTYVADASPDIYDYTHSVGMTHVDSVTFTGHGQGRQPRQYADHLDRRRDPVASNVARRLRELPFPRTPRPDPVYRLRAYRKAALLPVWTVLRMSQRPRRYSGSYDRPGPRFGAPAFGACVVGNHARPPRRPPRAVRGRRRDRKKHGFR